jgi:adenine-specific DNA methylase
MERPLYSLSADKIVSTDPPYFDNVGYADLSDFFYVWLRRSLRPCSPNLFETLVVPKSEELVATPSRHGGRAKAEKFFLAGMRQAMHRLAEQARKHWLGDLPQCDHRRRLHDQRNVADADRAARPSP